MFYTFSDDGKPTSAPVSTSHMMAYLRAPAEDEALVKKLVARACAAFARFTNGHIAAPAAYVIWAQPAELNEFGLTTLPIRPLLDTLNNVTVIHTNGNETDLEVLGLRGDDGFVLLDDLPSTARDERGIKIEAQFGYTDSTIPDEILLGIEQYVTFLYEQRGSEQVGIPMAVQALWRPFVRYSIVSG